MSKALDIASEKVVFNRVLNHCTPVSLSSLSRTSHVVHQAVQEYISLAININRALHPFFPSTDNGCADLANVYRFRSIQARTSTLIAGSFAYYFFNRIPLPHHQPLHLFVPMRFRRELGTWLTTHAGYDFVPVAEQDNNFENAVIDVHPGSRNHTRFQGPQYPVAGVFIFANRALNKTIQIFIAEQDLPPIALVLGLASTCLFNVISYEKAYSFFPKETFEYSRSLDCYVQDLFLNAVALDPLTCSSIQFTRNYHVFSTPPGSSTQELVRYRVSRWTNDVHTWQIHLPLEGVEMPPPFDRFSARMIHDPVDVANWEILSNTRAKEKVKVEVTEVAVGMLDLSLHPGPSMQCDPEDGDVEMGGDDAAEATHIDISPDGADGSAATLCFGETYMRYNAFLSPIFFHPYIVTEKVVVRHLSDLVLEILIKDVDRSLQDIGGWSYRDAELAEHVVLAMEIAQNDPEMQQSLTVPATVMRLVPGGGGGEFSLHELNSSITRFGYMMQSPFNRSKDIVSAGF